MLRARLIAAVLAVLAAGCARAGTVTVSYPSYPDSTDPALSYTVAGWQILRQTHTGLIAYARAEGEAGLVLIPGLAEALPAVSPDGRTYTFRLRRGLRYSNGTPVHARDFEHAIKRLIALESGGTSFYTSTITGAERYRRRGRAPGDISGIRARGRTITVRLTAPNAQFPYIVAMPFASLVPSSTPFEVMRRTPGVGPMRMTSVRPPNRIVLKRNPRFSLPGVPRATGDTVRIVRNARTWDLQDDPDAPRPPHTRSVETGATYFFFLNQRTPPFDRKEVRRAVHFGLDKRAITAAAGVQYTPTCTFVPPLLLPQRRADPCPFGDPAGEPQVDRARQMIAAAGASRAEVTVYGNDEPNTRRVIEAWVAQLNAIGLRARPRIVDPERYFQVIGRQSTGAQAGFANWFMDFPHPGSFFFLVDPQTIQRTNNQNFGNVEDPRVRSELARLAAVPLPDALAGYAALDRHVVEEAHVIPWGLRTYPINTSARVRAECVVWHPVLGVDLSRLCLA